MKPYISYNEGKIKEPLLWERHCHTQYEMIAVAEGDITVLLEGQSYRLQKNQICILPPLSYHSVTANKGGLYRRVTALFDAEFIPNPLADSLLGNKVGIVIQNSPVVERLVEFARKENRDFYEPLIESLMIEVLYEATESEEIAAKVSVEGFLREALDYIDAHLHEKISLSDLARHSARSKSSFCHLFEEKMNISPGQYIREKKLAVANKLISEGHSRTDAASAVGYDNYSSFYRLCKRGENKKN